MQTINLEIKNNENKDYSIFIGENATDKVFDVLEKLAPQKILVVTNETIYELYSQLLIHIFEKVKTPVEYCILPDGENYKNKSSLETILACAFENKLERTDVMIAFGGGVIGDITGFAASVYLRGIRFVQIPTTILAQVDSSVGGKVAINTPYGKNLIGAFYQPKAVISDLKLLTTLPKRQVISGLSEVVKYSFIEKNCDVCFEDFAKYLYSNQKSILNLDVEKLELAIEKSCILKSCVVNQDEKEKGLRVILNFGHTIGHAIEKCTQYKVFTHGEAIAIGMKAIFLIALYWGKINEEYYSFAIELLKSYGLDFNIPKEVTVDQLMNSLWYDKKVQNGKIRFVLPVSYAKVDVFDDVDFNIVKEVLKEMY